MRLFGIIDSAISAGERTAILMPPFGRTTVAPPTVQGLEYTAMIARLHFSALESMPHYTAPENRLHFTGPENMPHFTAPTNRPHYTSMDEDK